MKKFYLLIIICMFLISFACLAYPDKQQDSEDAVDRAPGQPEENLEDIEEDTEPLEGLDDEVVEAPPPKVEGPLDVLLNHHGFTETQKDIIYDMYHHGNDIAKDYIVSISDWLRFEDNIEEVDLRGVYKVLADYDKNTNVITFGNTLFPCDSDIEGGFVVCTDNYLPMEPGLVHIVIMHMEGEIPIANPDRFYTYSAVFDSDGDPANNFQFVDPYDWDLYQNTDLWYILDWWADRGDWTLEVLDGTANYASIPSAARAVVMGKVVAFFIPASEFATANPGFRVTTFAHDGTFNLDTALGDVPGADPTEPLLIGSEEPIVIE